MTGRGRGRKAAAAQWAAGLALLAGALLVSRAGLRAAARTPELAVRLPETGPLLARGSLPGRFVASPPRVRERLEVRLDGEARPARATALPGDEERFALEAGLDAALAPGFHVLEFRPGYGQPEPRSAALGFVTGPFGDPRGWSPRGVRVVVSQELLDRLEAPLARLVEDGLAGRLAPHTRRPDLEVEARLDLSWSARGLAVEGDVALEGTRARFATELALEVDREHRVRLRRAGELRAEVEGKLVRRGRLYGAGAGAGAGALLGPWGALGGAVVGLVSGSRVVEKKARGELDRFIDERLRALEGTLGAPAAISVGEPGHEARIELRPSGPPELRPGRWLHLDLDVRVLAPRADDRPGPVLDGRVPPPAPPTAERPATVTVSLDAFNRVLHGLWASGTFERLANQRAAKRRLREALAATVFEVGEVRLAAPPVVGRGDGEALLVVLPRIEAALRDREEGREMVALFAGRAALTASVGGRDGALRFWMGRPEIWAACRVEAPEGGPALSPCLSELMDLVRQRVDEAATRRQPLLSLPTRLLLPLPGGRGDDGGPLGVRIEGLDVRLPRDEGSGVVVSMDPRVARRPSAAAARSR